MDPSPLSGRAGMRDLNGRTAAGASKMIGNTMFHMNEGVPYRMN